jgi:hypothetical protein
VNIYPGGVSEVRPGCLRAAERGELGRKRRDVEQQPERDDPAEIDAADRGVERVTDHSGMRAVVAAEHQHTGEDQRGYEDGGGPIRAIPGR